MKYLTCLYGFSHFRGPDLLNSIKLFQWNNKAISIVVKKLNVFVSYHDILIINISIYLLITKHIFNASYLIHIP